MTDTLLLFSPTLLLLSIVPKLPDIVAM